MASKRAFRLTATHPSGAVKQHVHPTLKEARLYLSYSIYDNGYGDKKTAQVACMIPAGESVTISGATYTIEQVAA
jgi:hypothetical protein